MREVTELRTRLERALRLEAALLTLARVDDQPYDARVDHILRVDARTLGISRVSYWTFRSEDAAIQCDSLYIAPNDRFESGLVLHQRDYPAYFEAMRQGRPIVAADAHTHPATREFSAGYLTPNGIGAMLDVPVYVRGALLGVVCHEHVGGAREFADDEQMFAVAIGQQMALAIEARRREAAEADVLASEARFRSIVEASPIPTAVTRAEDNVCLYANAALSAAVGVPLDELVGRPAMHLRSEPGRLEALLAELEERGRVVGREVQLERADGSRYWALLSLVNVDFGVGPAIISSFHDLTPQKDLEEKLRVMALHDPLTGLANRALILDRLRNEGARADRDPAYRFGVMFIDLDEFKTINDEHGHGVGDRLLIEVAVRLLASLRATDTAGRVGGDEFVVLLAGIDDPTEAASAAHRIARRLSEPFSAVDPPIEARASIGVAVGRGGRDPGDVLRSADAAMYRAKQRKGAGPGVEVS